MEVNGSVMAKVIVSPFLTPASQKHLPKQFFYFGWASLQCVSKRHPSRSGGSARLQNQSFQMVALTTEELNMV
jgi:hypothetical protein